MTHDELLARIDNALESNICYERVDGIVVDMYPRQHDIDLLFKALRAVVELHKPIEISGEELCDACEEWTNEGANYHVYPCPTIQAIEKELG